MKAFKVFLKPFETLKKFEDKFSLLVPGQDGKNNDIEHVSSTFFWSVFCRIRTDYGEITAKKTSVFRHFSHSGKFCIYHLYLI